MSTTWSIGPSFNPFTHTSNSQYGAWSSSPGYNAGTSGGATAQIVNGAFIPKPPAPRVSDVTARDVAKIVSAVEPIIPATKEKFSDFMSKYGSAKVPSSSQYDRIVAMHQPPALNSTEAEKVLDRVVAMHKQPTLNSTGPEKLLDFGAPKTSSYGKSLHSDIILASHGQHGMGSYIPHQKSPSQGWPINDSDISEYALHRTSTALGTLSDSKSKYSTDMGEGHLSMKRTDQNNNMLHTSGYKLENQSSLSRPGLSRSNTFSGSTSSQSTNNSRYTDTRVPLDKLFNSDANKHDMLKGADSRYISPGFRAFGDAKGNHLLASEMESSLKKNVQSSGIGMRDPGSLAAQNSPRDNGTVSRDPKSPMYWLYGNQGRPHSDTTAVMHRTGNPYRPGDYMLTSDPEYQKYSSNALETFTKDYGMPKENVPMSTHMPYSERSRYDSTRPSTPYSSNRYHDDYPTESAYEHLDNRAPEIVSRPVGHQRSILKKGRSGSGSLYSGLALEGPTYRANTLNKQLPPLASGTLRRTSGKKVTFNLAMNKFRAFID